MSLTEEEQTALVTSEDPHHPANLICELCRNFYTLGWVTGTGGGISIRKEEHIYIAPSGVQKERLEPHNMFILEYPSLEYLRRPINLKPSACTPLFLAAYDKGAGACIHTHSQWAVLVTLINKGKKSFKIANTEMIKGIPRPSTGKYYGYHDTLEIPIIENTAHEEDLRDSLAQAIKDYPDTSAVLVRRHGVYVWGDTVWKAKTQAECYDYLFQLAVEMTKLGLDPAGPIDPLEE
ncbi:Methylthioribulose-1-phosphate dehydratase [Orbilia oligospora]|uniref:Methylthioribulose-1-phosphate dehydratase n=1 Tax=Orbilia oligospora TaxID=2813651 RepID=A0A7C8KG33_ORBOL|nr:Methylthioribulose-1-phosphate dehydratase [Orbilia oligospora]KAF3122866.1 Methylthioribulose-1-phosphate dehydratase [Orbilia oligospora]KAF3136447.1 Methylthioribulose-1-phosphate dehydratase [Orbilia oligospora]KAF3175215.1 Methylthioribulose-1-phosphate dehydratase [Orbilia oligospora]KAF3191697.1 Methylthioribulose-1-phosphate dehydratase [Orbilia oligospora]